MRLPGTLSASTLGDLLGSLHRAGLSGTLELREKKGPKAGALHRIHLLGGLVAAVELDAVGDETDPAEPACAERDHVLRSMEILYALPDARLSFHVARRRRDSARPLPPQDFLHGRPRHRDVRNDGADETRAKVAEGKRARALATLGLAENASVTEAHRAFRLLALRLHPDHQSGLSEAEKKGKTSRFMSVLSAYQELLAKTG